MKMLRTKLPESFPVLTGHWPGTCLWESPINGDHWMVFCEHNSIWQTPISASNWMRITLCDRCTNASMIVECIVCTAYAAEEKWMPEFLEGFDLCNFDDSNAYHRKVFWKRWTCKTNSYQSLEFENNWPVNRTRHFLVHVRPAQIAFSYRHVCDPSLALIKENIFYQILFAKWSLDQKLSWAKILNTKKRSAFEVLLGFSQSLKVSYWGGLDAMRTFLVLVEFLFWGDKKIFMKRHVQFAERFTTIAWFRRDQCMQSYPCKIFESLPNAFLSPSTPLSVICRMSITIRRIVVRQTPWNFLFKLECALKTKAKSLCR